MRTPDIEIKPVTERWISHTSPYENTALFKQIVHTLQTWRPKAGESYAISFTKDRCDKYADGADPMNFRRSILETFKGRNQGGKRSAGWLKREDLHKIWSIHTDKVKGVPRIVFTYTPITRVMTRKGEHKTVV